VRVLTPRKFACVVAVSAAALALALVLAPGFGSVDASLFRVLAGRAAADERTIVLSLRFPRAILAALAGGTLAACGTAMQGILANPLADPYTLGLASGASLAAVVAMKLGASSGLLTSLAAFAGALASAAAVWGLSRLGRRKRLTPEGLLLAGVTLTFVASAGVLLIQYVSEPFEIHHMIRWMMGGLGTVGYRTIAAMTPVLMPALVLIGLQAGRLNQIALSEELAESRGVDVRRVRLLVLAGTALGTGAAVAAAGPVGFVGLIVPHAMRFLVGPDHRLLVPSAFLWGGAFLVACDTVARTVTAPMDIPVGVFTALLGGPFFLWILATRRG